MKRTSSAFVPDIWSQNFDETFFSVRQARSFLMKELTRVIDDWSKMGLTPEQIAEKIDPEMFEDRWGEGITFMVKEAQKRMNQISAQLVAGAMSAIGPQIQIKEVV